MLAIEESTLITPETDDPSPPRVSPSDPAAAAVRAALAEGVHWLRVNQATAREGSTEGVHHLRTTTRRLRSSLGLFRDLTDTAWSDRLAEELKWLAGKLGDVRDLDVMIERFRADADTTGDALGPLFEAFAARRSVAAETLAQTLESDRFRALAASLAEAVAAPPLVDDAWEPCRTVLPRLVTGAWDSLKRAGRALAKDDPDDDFHEVRKRAKRARYAAEAVKGALEPGAARAAAAFARRARRVQDVLGTHQDAVLAVAEVRKAALDRPADGPFNFAAGRLCEREQHAADAARAEFFEHWRALDRKALRRWLKP